MGHVKMRKQGTLGGHIKIRKGFSRHSSFVIDKISALKRFQLFGNSR